MDTETLDRLFLEWGQFTEARTAKEIALTEALEPFARVAYHDIGVDESDADLFRPISSRYQAPPLTVGDLRRALRIIEKIKAGDFSHRRPEARSE
jgi:hypothetical protein